MWNWIKISLAGVIFHKIYTVWNSVSSDQITSAARSRSQLEIFHTDHDKQITLAYISWVLHGKGIDRSPCLTEQTASDVRSTYCWANTRQDTRSQEGVCHPWLRWAGPGGALILKTDAVRPGGAAIREGAVNRDNTVCAFQSQFWWFRQG